MRGLGSTRNRTRPIMVALLYYTRIETFKDTQTDIERKERFPFPVSSHSSYLKLKVRGLPAGSQENPLHHVAGRHDVRRVQRNLGLGQPPATRTTDTSRPPQFLPTPSSFLPLVRDAMLGNYLKRPWNPNRGSGAENEKTETLTMTMTMAMAF